MVMRSAGGWQRKKKFPRKMLGSAAWLVSLKSDGQNRYHADHCGNPSGSQLDAGWHWIKACQFSQDALLTVASMYGGWMNKMSKLVL